MKPFYSLQVVFGVFLLGSANLVIEGQMVMLLLFLFFTLLNMMIEINAAYVDKYKKEYNSTKQGKGKVHQSCKRLRW